MSWETESDREWDRQYYGCSCRGDPRVVNCPECDDEYCARCTEHRCAKPDPEDFEAAADAVVDTIEGLIQAIEDEAEKPKEESE